MTKQKDVDFSFENTDHDDEITNEAINLIETQPSTPEAPKAKDEKAASTPQHAAKPSKPRHAPLSEEEKANREAQRAFRRLTSIEDQPHFNNSLRALLGGDILAGKWFRRHVFYIIFIVLLTLIYVSARYSCQQALIEQNKLQDTLIDRRYKALTRSSQLKEKTRRSNIEESLVDTTLQTASTPSFNLKVEE